MKINGDAEQLAAVPENVRKAERTLRGKYPSLYYRISRFRNLRNDYSYEIAYFMLERLGLTQDEPKNLISEFIGTNGLPVE